MLMGLLEPTCGEVLVDGANIHRDLVGYRIEGFESPLGMEIARNR